MKERVSQSAVTSWRKDAARLLPENRFIDEPDTLLRYGQDWSKTEGYAPDVVVRPRSTEEVQQVLQSAHLHRVPVTPRGLGTGKAGGAIPVFGGIVLSTESMNRVGPVHSDDLAITSQSGAITKAVMDAAEDEGFFYPPDPNSLDICSIGGNVATNAGGPRALKYGVTKHYVLAVEVVLADGRCITLGKRTPKYVSGYDLCSLIVGSEGTLAVITQCTLRLIARPRAVQTALVCFDDVYSACKAVTEVLKAGITPRTLELLDEAALAAVAAEHPGRYPSGAKAMMILETDGSLTEHAEEDLLRAADACSNAGALEIRVAQDEAQRKRIWEPRRTLSEALARTARYKISEDVVVPRSRLPELVARVRKIGEQRGIRVATYGHAGDGNLHVNLLFEEGQRPQAEAAGQDVLRTAVELEGALSGEHGIGITKKGAFHIEHGTTQRALHRGLKSQLDPHGILNPGKIWQPEVT